MEHGEGKHELVSCIPDYIADAFQRLPTSKRGSGEQLRTRNEGIWSRKPLVVVLNLRETFWLGIECMYDMGRLRRLTICWSEKRVMQFDKFKLQLLFSSRDVSCLLVPPIKFISPDVCEMTLRGRFCVDSFFE
jgi:hypothetical protein